MIVIRDPIYNAEFLFQAGGSLEAVIKKYAKWLDIEVPDTKDHPRREGHFCASETHKGGVIWVKDLRSVNSLAHECLHATYHIMKNMGIMLNDNSEEAYSYYLGWLVETILKKGKNGNNRKRNT